MISRKSTMINNRTNILKVRMANYKKGCPYFFVTKKSAVLTLTNDILILLPHSFSLDQFVPLFPLEEQHVLQMLLE